MSIRKVEFVSGGCKCSSWLYLPRSWRRPAKLPVVVLVPGASGFIHSAGDGDCGHGLDELARNFMDAGFVACSYDGRGQGRSEGVRTGHHIVVEDLEAALDLVVRRCEASDCDRIGLFGQSLGGMAATLLAARDPGIRSLVLWGTLPRYSGSEMGKDPRIVGNLEALHSKSKCERPLEEFTRDFKVYDPIDFIGKLTIPVLLAGGSEDVTLFRPGEQAEFLSASREPGQMMLLSVGGEHHRIRHSAMSFRVLAGLLSAWFAETI